MMTISERLIDQRLRNRIMETLEVLASGAAGVRRVGAIEFFEGFYDLLPYREYRVAPTNTTIGDGEWAALGTLWRLMDEACDSTARDVTDVDLILSGWPDRIRPAAEAALALMQKRGRCSEDAEETTPGKQE